MYHLKKIQKTTLKKHIYLLDIYVLTDTSQKINTLNPSVFKRIIKKNVYNFTNKKIKIWDYSIWQAV